MSDRDRAIDEALAGRASVDHPDLEAVAAFAAELRRRGERVPVRPSPAVNSLMRGDKDLATYVELDTERSRRRPALVWAAAAAVAVAIGGIAATQPWDRGTNTPTAASITSAAELSTETRAVSETPAPTPPPTVEPIVVTTTEMSPPATAAATVPPVTVETPTTTMTTVKPRPPETAKTTVVAPPPPTPGLEEAKAKWRACALSGQQDGLNVGQIASRCGAEPNLDAYRLARSVWETCMREHPTSGATACGPAPDPAAFGFVPPIWTAP